MEGTHTPPSPADEQELRAAWDAEQEALSRRVVEQDNVRWVLGGDEEEAAQASGASTSTSGCQPGRKLRLLGGVDLSFYGDDSSRAVASLVVLSFPDLQVVYESYSLVTLDLPYMSGYLAFREVGPLLRLIDKLRQDKPELVPDVIMVDGNGVLHPRACGLACHLGVLSGIPTIGCAKTFLHVDGLTTTGVKETVRSQLDASTGGHLPLKGDSGRVWGLAFRPNASVQNPIYVSVGHGLHLDTALRIVQATCKFRVPEPIRQADIRSRAVIREGRTPTTDAGGGAAAAAAGGGGRAVTGEVGGQAVVPEDGKQDDSPGTDEHKER